MLVTPKWWWILHPPHTMLIKSWKVCISSAYFHFFPLFSVRWLESSTFFFTLRSRFFISSANNKDSHRHKVRSPTIDMLLWTKCVGQFLIVFIMLFTDWKVTQTIINKVKAGFCSVNLFDVLGLKLWFSSLSGAIGRFLHHSWSRLSGPWSGNSYQLPNGKNSSCP